MVRNINHYGIIHGQWEDEAETLMKMEGIYEKPDKDYAREYLGTGRRNKQDKYYAVFSQYILTPEVFAQMEYNIRNDIKNGGEFQLTDALETVREKYGMYAFVPKGKSYDMGLPESYRETVWEYGRNTTSNQDF